MWEFYFCNFCVFFLWQGAMRDLDLMEHTDSKRNQFRRTNSMVKQKMHVLRSVASYHRLLLNAVLAVAIW